MSDYFEQQAATWDTNPQRQNLAKAIMDFISRRLPLATENSVLDYGCGTGLLSVLLSSKVKEVIAADTSKAMLEQLGGKIQASGITNISTMNLDIAKTPGEDKYDAVVSAMTLHHLDNALAGIKGLVSLVKPNGWIALADLCPEDGSFHSDVEVKYHGFAPDEICRNLQDLGIKNPTWEEVFVISKNSRQYAVFCICGQKLHI